MTARIAEYEATRRDALGTSLVVGAGVVAASAVPFLLRIGNAFAEAEDDEAIVVAAIELEQQAVVVYGEAVKSGKLDAGATRTARRFQRDEQAHADALTAALEDLGGKAPPKPASAAAVPGLAEAAGGDSEAITRFAIELETMAVKAYYDAAAKLEDPKLLRVSVSIMANEAQHQVVLRQALGQDPSPSAFVIGSE